MVGGCCVCSDERGWAENPLVYCDGHACSVAVHQGKAEGGAAGGGLRDPGGGARTGCPRPRPPEPSWGACPSPTHLKRRAAWAPPPSLVLQDRVRHCFLAYCSSPAPPTPS